jgi:hypothetical protein
MQKNVRDDQRRRKTVAARPFFLALTENASGNTYTGARRKATGNSSVNRNLAQDSAPEAPPWTLHGRE